MDKAKSWKLIVVAAMALLLTVPAAIWMGIGSPAVSAQTESGSQPTSAAESETELELYDPYVGAALAWLDLAQPGRLAALSEQVKLARQNQLLTLINSMELSKEQLTKLKTITVDLIKSRDESRAALAKAEQQINEFLIKFKGTDAELQRGLVPLRQIEQAVLRAYMEKVSAAEQAVASSLSLAQGQKLLRNVQQLKQRFPGMGAGHGRGMIGMPGQRKPGQGQGPQQPGRPGQMQQPQVGAIGQLLNRNLNVLDEVLGLKIAALGS